MNDQLYIRVLFTTGEMVFDTHWVGSWTLWRRKYVCHASVESYLPISSSPHPGEYTDLGT
jgi:hypothetical protein